MQNKRKNQKDRNKSIREEIKQLVEQGFQVKLAISIVADKWYLSPATIRDIVYDKRRA